MSNVSNRIVIKALVIVLVLFPTTAAASDFYLGIVIGIGSRAGVVMGYKIDSQNRMEFTMFGVGTQLISTGLSLKRYNARDSKDYLTLGYAIKVVDRSEAFKGVQLGVGRNVNRKDGKKTATLELAAGPSYNPTTEQWKALGSFGYGIL